MIIHLLVEINQNGGVLIKNEHKKKQKLLSLLRQYKRSNDRRLNEGTKQYKELAKKLFDFEFTVNPIEQPKRQFINHLTNIYKYPSSYGIDEDSQEYQLIQECHWLADEIFPYYKKLWIKSSKR